MTSDQCVYMAGFFILLSFGFCTSREGLMDNFGYHVIETNDHVDEPMDTNEVTSWEYKDMSKDGARDDMTQFELDGYGIGIGSGYGSGDGVGSGYGQGSNFNSGSGNLGGYGEGQGSGSGTGGGSGYGEGRGYGSGSGQDCIPGYNCPVASTPCPHCGYPIAMPPLVQGCAPWGAHAMGKKTTLMSHEPNMEMNSADEQVKASRVHE